MQKSFIYRASQLLSLLLGARIFLLIFFAFALYVSAFLLFNQEETFRQFIFDYKVNGIILCSILTIAAGGIINQFYDLEKDKIQRPFRTKLQTFLKQNYFLYSYIVLNIVSLGVAFWLSFNIFIFFIAYQFMIWFYSHKLSKILVINNLSFVSITLYPFFGILIYYQHFSKRLFFMALFLFILLLIIDILKDILTIRADAIFNYKTLPISFGLKISRGVLGILLMLNTLIGYLIIDNISNGFLLKIYFGVSSILFLLLIFPIIFFRLKNIFWLHNLLRLWIFIGLIFMLLNRLY